MANIEDKVCQERIASVRRAYIRWARARPHCQAGCLESITPEPITPEPLTFQIPKTTGYCAICQEHLTTDFPKDYPDEWKFCCSCLGWAKSIVVRKKEDWVKKALNISPTIKKIYERITIVS